MLVSGTSIEAIEAAMKTMLLVCKKCGYEKKVKIYSREEAERNNMQLIPPMCDKCGNANVKLYD